jgi:hypothetical protein
MGYYFASAERSVFSDEKKLSIAALSQTLPDRLMLEKQRKLMDALFK